MLKKLIILIGLVAAGTMLTSCFDDNVRTYDGPLQLEIKPGTQSVPQIQQNPQAEGVSRSIFVSAQLIGPLQTTTHSGSLTWVPDESVAISTDDSSELFNLELGVHFELVGCDFDANNVCSFQIAPSDSLVKDFELRFLLDEISTRSQNTVVFELNDTPGSAYMVAPNLRRSVINAIRGNN
ncbi:MAG: hypothetical protein LAT67_07365 [Balneolales bacterium]|nr:hypothetical protein [Balneolales bacterium]